jgi:anti-sigma regulatory factor (Ser/Thr protein kinase)/CheY-like chemotaxis protein
MAINPTQTPSLPESQRALVVSSSPELDKLLSDIFNESHWAFEFVPSNKAALDRASAEKFDLIVTGEGTTGKQDVELLRRLRLVRPHTRLIILTEEFVPGDVLAAIRERAFSYFARPFSTEKLNEIIHVAMTEPFWDDGIEILSATPNWVRLCVRCDPVTANRLIQFFREASDLPDVETEEVATAFREILLNAIEHGGHFDPSQHVEIGYVRTRRMVICRVKDPGQGFSINELKHAAVTNPPEDPFQHMSVREERGLRPGGFGILMAKKLVDELLYNEKGNEVILVKNLDIPKPETAASA